MVLVILLVIAVIVVAGVIAVSTLLRSRSGLDDVAEPPPAPVGRPAPAATTPVVSPPSAPVETTASDARALPPSDVELEPDAGFPEAGFPEARFPDAEAITEAEILDAELDLLRRPRLRDRLGKARAALAATLGEIRLRDRIDDGVWDGIEEALIRADIGVTTTQALLDRVRARAKEAKPRTPEELVDLVKTEIVDMLGSADRTFGFVTGELNVWLFVGVNGVGKTTTIGKLAMREKAAGRRIVLAAADTFRAAAAEQLGVWAQRTGVDVIRGQEGADPGSIVFDAVASARSKDADLVLVDTAGRLHTKVNLMNELEKVRRIIVDKSQAQLREVLLVLDATTGQNGLQQARQFCESVGVTGVVLTKLDGTAKGGIVLAIQEELGIPVKAVGVGETVGDLIEFDPVDFVDALF